MADKDEETRMRNSLKYHMIHATSVRSSIVEIKRE